MEGPNEDIFVYKHVVRPEEIDPLGHASNVAYVQWMQDAAVAHSTALGWPGSRYMELGAGWVVRSHQIEYLHPARLGDTVVIRTWVASMERTRSLRRYEMFRQSDGRLLARAETLWAFIDFATGNVRRIPPEIAQAFPLRRSENSREPST
ncbi:MAG: acyl-CoA thioesterase [Thermoguttaceae bacterium]|nr:acyl-CoA thioesterase [Thermoguttaceae bacterium]MDW8080170.1 acyl-CoA thioesterase [Thermoguttaceae bacterium]